MSVIDNITIILGPPASAAEKTRLAEEAEANGASFDDTYIARIAGIVAELTTRTDGNPSEIETFFCELLERPVQLQDTIPTWFEKKGQRYPAIMIAARDVIDMQGNSLEDAVTKIFMRPETPAKLAERIGVRLDLESAKTFYTFGTNG